MKREYIMERVNNIYYLNHINENKNNLKKKILRNQTNFFNFFYFK